MPQSGDLRVEQRGADVTRLLNRAGQGDGGAEAALLPLVYQELRQLAKSKLRRERPDHTLQATALVHEACLRLVDQSASFRLGRSVALLRGSSGGDATHPRRERAAAGAPQTRRWAAAHHARSVRMNRLDEARQIAGEAKAMAAKFLPAENKDRREIESLAAEVTTGPSTRP